MAVEMLATTPPEPVGDVVGEEGFGGGAARAVAGVAYASAFVCATMSALEPGERPLALTLA